MNRVDGSRIATIVSALFSALAAMLALSLDALLFSSQQQPPLSAGWSGVLPGIAMLVPGCLLLWRLPWHPIALVLTGFGTLWVLDGLAAAAVNYAWAFDRSAWWAIPAFWFFSRLGSVLLLPIVLLLLIFPDGRLRSRGWRVVSIAAIALGLVMPFAFLFAPAAALNRDDDSRTQLIAAFEPRFASLPLPIDTWLALLSAGTPCLAISLLLALAVCLSRRFGASVEERAQLRWLLWSGLIFIATLVVVFPLVPTTAVDLLLAVTIGLVCASVVVAVSRYRLYSIDRLLSWTLVYAAIIAGVLLVDVAIIVAVGSAIDDRAAMLLAVVAVTIAYAPLRGRLFAIATRVVSGRRDEPYAVVSSLGDRLDRAADAHGQLAELAAAIAEAFRSRSVRVELERAVRGPLVATYGTPVSDASVFPITHRGEDIGRIYIEAGRRPVVSTRDQRLLGDLVRLAASSLRDAELSRELQASRENLVLAREEERSRLRRELHDGLGPLLAGVKLRLEAARNLARRDPERAIALVEAAIGDQSDVIDEIRRIVHGLRPPALDDLGLRGALDQLAERLSGSSLHARVTGTVPAELPPAVEVAAFRIASEALTNAQRHSGASQVELRLTSDGRALRLEVRDDGHGVRPPTLVIGARRQDPGQHSGGGVGLQSLRERAAELGGDFEIVEATGGGTVVRATLPLMSPTAHEAAAHTRATAKPQPE